MADKPKKRPSISTSHQQSRLVALAMDVAEEMLMKRTAPATLVTQILRSGTVRDELEIKILEQKEKLLQAQTDQIAQNSNKDEKYDMVMRAMKKYNGAVFDEDDEDDY